MTSKKENKTKTLRFHYDSNDKVLFLEIVKPFLSSNDLNEMPKDGLKKEQDSAIKSVLETLMPSFYNQGEDKIQSEQGIMLNVPYVRNGFENSCSESSAEMVLRYWGVDNWDQKKIHQYGYQTFEGNISVGDLGLLNMFLIEDFRDEDGNAIEFNTREISSQSKSEKDIEELKEFLLKGIPIIVRIFTTSVDKHTIVLIGFSESGFIFHDNDRGPSLFMSFSDFQRVWTGYAIILKIEKKT